LNRIKKPYEAIWPETRVTAAEAFEGIITDPYMPKKKA